METRETKFQEIHLQIFSNYPGTLKVNVRFNLEVEGDLQKSRLKRLKEELGPYSHTPFTPEGWADI